MEKIVVDSHAWINYFTGRSERIKDLIENNELHTSIFNVAEIVSRVERDGIKADSIVQEINQLSKIWYADLESVLKAGKLHVKMRQKIKDFGLGDCFVIELAERLNAKILTGDKHFKGLKNVIFIE